MRVRMIGTAVAVAFALALTGCSSDSDDSATSDPTTPAATEATVGDIVEVASGNPDFSILTTALTEAGLVETLQGPGPFTVFAPTNEAFEALPEGLLDTLLLPENEETLTAILTYHVVPAEVPSSAIEPGDVATVEGSTVTLATDDGVTVNDATVTTADVEASNGVIHVIDAVLVPPSVDVASLS